MAIFLPLTVSPTLTSLGGIAHCVAVSNSVLSINLPSGSLSPTLIAMAEFSCRIVSRGGRMIPNADSRRRFLKFLSGSPLLAYPGLAGSTGHGPLAPSKLPDPILWAPMKTEDLIASPKEAINVFDFEPVARKNIPPAHFGYMASGIDDEVTLRANREGFLKFQLRPRRLVDVSKVDMSVDLFGTRYPSPIIVAPVGGQKAFHAEGEMAVARAAKAGDHAMILSTQTTSSVEDVTKARGGPIWMQLYATNKFEVAAHHIKRAENAGCTAVAVTVDRSGGRNQETLFRLTRTDTRDCNACHDRTSIQTDQGNKPI